MRTKGELTYFNDERGFGFIKAEGRERKTFVHISELIKGGIDFPEQGMMLTFDIGIDRNGRQTAMNVEEAI